MEEGIYRVNGTAMELRRLKTAFDESSSNGTVLAVEADISVVAGTVKQFFRDLPDPLFPQDMYEDFVVSLQEEDEKLRDESMLDNFGDIPEPNISVIVRLIQHIQ